MSVNTDKSFPFGKVSDNAQFMDVHDVHPTEVQKHLSQCTIIDVRQPEEFTSELGHIPGAKLMVLGTLPQRFSEIPKDQTIVFVCRSGGRSAQATAFAKDQGLKNIFNMQGGMLLWNELKFPTEK
jgi:hydroxyacylglutathione hydrolase